MKTPGLTAIERAREGGEWDRAYDSARSSTISPDFQAALDKAKGAAAFFAKLDGANPLRIFLSVVVPVSRNGIITAALFSFLFAWSDFVFALTLTSANTVTPVTLGIYQFLGSDVQQWTPVMATAVLASIPAAALLVLAQRYIASGITGGAVK